MLEMNLIKIIKDNNIDGVITMSMIDSDESMDYELGRTVTVPTDYYRYGPYAFQRYSTIHEPGYYVETKSYLIEAVLHDLRNC